MPTSQTSISGTNTEHAINRQGAHGSTTRAASTSQDSNPPIGPGEPLTTPTISISGTQSFTYNGSALGPATISYSGDGTTSLVYTNVGGAAYSSVIAPSNIGNYQVVVNATATSNYNAASSSAYTFTINAATPTVTVTPIGTYTYNGNLQGPNAATNNGTGSSYTFSYTGVYPTTYSASSTQPTTSGSYTVTATVAANGNYALASSTPTAFTIAKATPTLTVTNALVTYDGTSKSAMASALGGGVVSNITTGGSASQTNAGTYAVTADIATSTNYNAATGITATNSFVIDKASQTIVFDALPIGKTTGDVNFAPGASSTTSGLNAIIYSSSNIAVATIVSGNIHLVGAGTCSIYANQTASDNYNAASQTSQNLTVILATQIINDHSTHNSSVVLTGTTTELTVSGTGTVLNVDNSLTLKSLTATTGAQVVVNTPLTISAGVILGLNSTLELANTTTVKGNVEVGLGANLKLSTANTLNITGDLILKATETSTENTSFSAYIGTGTMAINGEIKYLKTIDDTRWYFISFPSDVTINSITGSPALGTLGVNWFIKYYDGAQRGTSGTGLVNWKTITSTMAATTYTKLNKYQGYIIGLASGSSEITFTLDKSFLSTEAANRTVPVAANNAGEISPTNHGWNLIGQPYLSQYIAKDGLNVANTSGATAYNIYVSDGTSTYTPYTQTTVPNINPMSAYFIQASSGLAGSGIIFGLGGRRQSAMGMIKTDLSDEVKINFTSNTGTDYTLLIMDNNHSTVYEIGYDLEKWIGTGTVKPQVYTLLGGINYAFNALPMSSVNDLPVGIYTQTAGITTISVDATKVQNLSKLFLTDNSTSPVSVTDLLTSNYSFTAAAGTNNTRFTITAQRNTTDNNVIGSELGENHLIITPLAIGIKLTVSNLADNSTVRVFDALGRMVISKNATSNTLEIKLNTKGIYTVQLQNGTTITTRKVIF